MVANFGIAKYRVLVLSGMVAIALGGLLAGSIQWLRIQRRQAELSVVRETSPTQDIAGISMGEKLMLQGDRHPLKLRGIEAYQRGDYAAAQKFFLQSWHEEAQDPESLIYFNNARVSQQPVSVTLAVVVSMADDAKTDWAKEILRGIAQAQKEFIDDGNALRIVIGDDDGNSERAAQLAQQLVDLPEVLGVIGHLSSDLSLSAAKVYQAGKLVAISPTATSVDLSGAGNYLFRTAPNDRLTAEMIANYLLQERRVKRIAIVYDSRINYSVSLQKSFAASLVTGGGSAPLLFDVSAADFDAEASFTAMQQAGMEAIALFTGTSALDETMTLIRANQNQLPMVAGDSLYRQEVLQESAKNATSLTIAVPWHPDSNPSALFPVDSRALWQGEDVTWRTALTFDAAEALIHAIQEAPAYTRQSIQTILTDPDFITEGAADGIDFAANGDRRHPLVLVTVAKIDSSDSGYAFVPLQVIDE